MATKEQAKVITSEQFQAIKTKLANGGVLTAQEWQDLATYGTQQAQEETKTEALVADIIADLKKANIAPAKLTAILQQEGLITKPAVKGDDGRVYLYHSPKTTFPNNSRATIFKIWKGREIATDTKEVQEKWAFLKQQGKDAFMANLTPEGKKLYEEDESVKKYIDGLFA